MVGERGSPLLGFLPVFAGFVVINSMGLVAVDGMNLVSRACLITAIAAVGLNTSLVEMRLVVPDRRHLSGAR